MDQLSSRPDRITMKVIWEGVLDIFNLERGFFYTIYALTLRPGAAIREYIFENRTRLVPPFRFLVFIVAVATFLTLQYFKYTNWLQKFESGLEDGYHTNEHTAAGQQFLTTYMNIVTNIFNNYFNVIILIGVPILAWMTYLLLRQQLNYAEHLVINSYLTAYLTVIYILMIPILWLTNYTILSVVYFTISLLYSCYLCIQFFQLKITNGILKTLLINIFYVIIYYFLLIAFFVSWALVAISYNK